MQHRTVTFVTGNSNKLREVKAILCQTDGVYNDVVGNSQITNKPLDLDEIQGSVEDVTIHKASQAAALINGPILVEDTCLSFNALNGLPGPYIKWFVKDLGLSGLNKLLVGFDDKSAKAITTFGYCEGPGCEVKLFQGITTGTIVQSTGPTNFGWDSIFKPDGFDTTYAEMKGEAKNKISQRSKALAKVKEFLLNN